MFFSGVKNIFTKMFENTLHHKVVLYFVEDTGDLKAYAEPSITETKEVSAFIVDGRSTYKQLDYEQFNFLGKFLPADLIVKVKLDDVLRDDGSTDFDHCSYVKVKADGFDPNTEYRVKGGVKAGVVVPFAYYAVLTRR